jgi:ubiquinone/menaquinone biosynthesis C-methylase UbiE
MNDNLLDQKIKKRYSKKTGNEGLGCADLVPFFDIKKGDIVLDLGCGSGNQALRLCEMVGEHGFIFGVDITESMIEKAKLKNNRKNVEFKIGDIHEIPIETGNANVVLSNCVINHSPDKLKVFSEIFRVLKKGGHFLIGDVMAVDQLPAEISNDPEKIAECWGGAILKNEYFKILKKAGFSSIQELFSRKYFKNDFLLESIIIKGEKA